MPMTVNDSSTPQETLLFVQVFTGILVQVLSQNLNQERRKSDRLLRSVLPATIADELKQTDRVQPVDYEYASVLFTDFVGFTQIAESFTPQQLIEELDSCFGQFDRIAKNITWKGSRPLATLTWLWVECRSRIKPMRLTACWPPLKLKNWFPRYEKKQGSAVVLIGRFASAHIQEIWLQVLLVVKSFPTTFGAIRSTPQVDSNLPA